MEQPRQINDIEKKKVIIKCSNVNKTFVTTDTRIDAVRDFNIEVKENEFVVLFGPGQCGKTTLLNLIAGLEKATDGEVIVNDKTVNVPDPERGVVYQKTAIFPWLTVMGNVAFGPKTRGLKKKEWQQKARYYINLVGLNGFENVYPKKLSGGMKQRVGIARVYCNDPKVLLMDEPFGHLDAQTRYLMQEEVTRIWESEKRTILFVTNNIEEAIFLADRLVILTAVPTTIKTEIKINLIFCFLFAQFNQNTVAIHDITIKCLINILGQRPRHCIHSYNS